MKDYGKLLDLNFDNSLRSQILFATIKIVFKRLIYIRCLNIVLCKLKYKHVTMKM